jgi:hypothetical protein
MSRGAVAPGAFELQHDVTGAIALEPFVGDRGTRDVAAQAFESLSLMRVTAHPGMQAEAVRIGAQARGGFVVPAGHGSQAQHLLSGARHPAGEAKGESKSTAGTARTLENRCVRAARREAS